MKTKKAIRKVGFIGAGRMGMPMIGHVARKGFDVAVYDLDASKKKGVEQRKARWVRDVAGLCACDAILVCVGYDRELRELFAGGRLAGAAKGTIVAVLSTVRPATVVELVGRGAAQGLRVLDSTVCRGGKAADEGTLLSFVGGDAGDVSRLVPVIASYSTDIVHTGPAGTAQVAKAANNLVMWACLIANHEALALAQRHGMDVERLRAALELSSADNYVLRNWGMNTMAWAEDDMEIVQAMASEKGVALAQAGLNREILRALKPKRFRLEEYGT
jgi:3-hydroxyisobutyrate dehydrogenase-like beta-hydroxyacid dehydrogenase